MAKTLYIVRGLPGSGKSTLAAKLVGSDYVYEADQFFVRNGVYTFVPHLLKDAHAWCKRNVQAAMQSGFSGIAVANTFTQKWEYEEYLNLAEEYGYEVCVLVCQNNYGNIHGVPPEAIERMRNRWEN